MTHSPILLTSSQSGRLLGKSSKTVIRMAERGELPVAQKLPGPHGAYLFDAEVVQRMALCEVLGIEDQNELPFEVES